MSATGAIRPARSDRPLFVAAGLTVAVIVFIGFSRTFYLKGVFGGPPLSTLLVLHGVLMSLWITLFITQIGLVAAGRTDLHRRLGLAGALVALLIPIVGIASAIDAARRGFTPSPMVTPLGFMAVPMTDVVVFATLVGAALLNRRERAVHKRLMLLATLGILTPAVARLPIEGFRQFGPPAFFSVTVFCVVVVVAFDTVRNRRLHPAFAWGGAFLIASIPLRLFVAQTDAWAAFARRLVG